MLYKLQYTLYIIFSNPPFLPSKVDVEVDDAMFNRPYFRVNPNLIPAKTVQKTQLTQQ